MTVVSNTSPLILLGKIDRIDLLPQLYDDVLIPGSVLEEIEAKPGKAVPQIRVLLRSQQLQLQHAARHMLAELPMNLGAGEREAMALALETEADLVILDDQQGRQVARSKGMSVTGTVGVIIEARARSIVPSVRHEVDRLIEAGLWISEVLYHRIVQEFEE